MEVELYFIQLLFCRNRQLLLKEYRPVYDALFEKYKAIYEEGKRERIDLGVINNSFIDGSAR